MRFFLFALLKMKKVNAKKKFEVKKYISKFIILLSNQTYLYFLI